MYNQNDRWGLKFFLLKLKKIIIHFNRPDYNIDIRRLKLKLEFLRRLKFLKI